MLPEEREVHQLRELLRQKTIQARQARLETFRRRGRAWRVYGPPEGEPTPLPQAASPGAGTAERRRPARSRTATLLLGLEILAALTLVWVVVQGVQALQQLNQEARAALAQPTLTPTPWVRAVVLPGGHTPPDSPGGARPNLEEIPEHLRPFVQVAAPIAVPTPSPEHPIRIRIPAIGVDAPVVLGDDWEQLKKGVGWHIGSGLPGQRGNVVLSAHNDIYGEIFRDLDQLRPGDEIYIHTQRNVYTYVVTSTHIVKPTDVAWMDPTREPMVTLISCYPYRVNTHRIIVRARLQTSTP